MNSQNVITRSNPKPDSRPASSSLKNKTPARSAAVQSKSDAEIPVARNNQPVAPAPALETRHESPSTNSAGETAFRVDAPEAREVLLAGEFTEWEKSPIKLIKGGGGVWHVKVPLTPGRHLYRFLVDGQWRDDQNRQERAPNPFGTQNSVVEIK